MEMGFFHPVTWDKGCLRFHLVRLFLHLFVHSFTHSFNNLEEVLCVFLEKCNSCVKSQAQPGSPTFPKSPFSL